MPPAGIPFSDYSRGRRHFLNEGQVMHAMCIDDMYHVDRTLAQGPGGTTELVSIGSTGPFVRKKIPMQLAHRRVWAALPECDNPRLPNVETTYELPDCFVVVYDYVPGETLEDRVQGKGRLDEAETTQLTGQICEAVQALHEHGIFHRDLSPNNIIIAADGAHLIDLGIARMHRENSTRDTTPLGTYGFAAPEQYGFAQSDERTDVYSIGRLLGYMLTGEKPLEESSAYDDALADETRVPAHLRRVAQRACAFEPSARYQSAADLARALAGEENSGDEAPAQASKASEAGDGRRSTSGSAAASGDTRGKKGGSNARQGHPATQARGNESTPASHGHGRATIVAIVVLAALCLALGVGWFLSMQEEDQTGATSGNRAANSLIEDASQSADSSADTQGTGDASSQAADGASTSASPVGDNADTSTSQATDDAGTGTSKVADDASASTSQATGDASVNTPQTTPDTNAGSSNANEQVESASPTADKTEAGADASANPTGDSTASTSAASTGASSDKASTASESSASDAASTPVMSSSTSSGASDATTTAVTSAPAASATAATPDTSQASSGLQLGQTLWAIDSDGYMTIAIEFVNTSDSEAYTSSHASVVARAEDDTVLTSRDVSTALVNPGTSAWARDLVYVGEKPASVEFSLTDSPMTSSKACEVAPVYSVDNLNVDASGALGNCRVTGDVTCAQDGSLSGDWLNLILIMRDKKGEFVASSNKIITRPKEGQSQAFEIETTKSLPQGGSCDVYVQEM